MRVAICACTFLVNRFELFATPGNITTYVVLQKLWERVTWLKNYNFEQLVLSRLIFYLAKIVVYSWEWTSCPNNYLVLSFAIENALVCSAFLGNIKSAYEGNPSLSSLLLDPFFRGVMARCQGAWRRVVSETALLGIPTPALSTALAFYDGYRAPSLPANLIQVSFLGFFT